MANRIPGSESVFWPKSSSSPTIVDNEDPLLFEFWDKLEDPLNASIVSSEKSERLASPEIPISLLDTLYSPLPVGNSNSPPRVQLSDRVTSLQRDKPSSVPEKVFDPDSISDRVDATSAASTIDTAPLTSLSSAVSQLATPIPAPIRPQATKTTNPISLTSTPSSPLPPPRLAPLTSLTSLTSVLTQSSSLSSSVISSTQSPYLPFNGFQSIAYPSSPALTNLNPWLNPFLYYPMGFLYPSQAQIPNFSPSKGMPEAQFQHFLASLQTLASSSTSTHSSLVQHSPSYSDQNANFAAPFYPNLVNETNPSSTQETSNSVPNVAGSQHGSKSSSNKKRVSREAGSVQSNYSLRNKKAKPEDVPPH